MEGLEVCDIAAKIASIISGPPHWVIIWTMTVNKIKIKKYIKL